MNENIQNAKAGKKSIYKSKKTAMIALALLVAVLLTAFFVASHFFKIKKVTLDGETYIVKPTDNVYSIYREDGTELEQPEEGYYALNSGNLVVLDKETGDVRLDARVDTTGTEQATDDGRVLIFPYVSRSALQSVSVSNEYGSFEFYKDANGNFRIKGYESTGYRGETLSYLIGCGGYTIANRIDREISIDKYGFSEYGFDSPLATYKITTLDGKTYDVEIGDMTVDGYGYYARYVTDSRQALYILPTSYIADSLLAPIEDFIYPVLNVKTSYNTYLDVQNCTLTHNTYDADGAVVRDVYARFSYLSQVGGEDRLDGEYRSQPFFSLGDLAMYVPSADSVNEMLYNLYTMTFIGTRHLGTEQEALAEYGLDTPAYTLYYETDFTETSASLGYSKKIFLHQYIYFSEKTPQGTYYAYSRVYQSSTGESGSYTLRDDYDQIVEIDASMLDFLSYSKAKWVNQDYFYLYMAYCDKIELERGDKKITLLINHTSDGSLVTISDGSGRSYTLSPDAVAYVDQNGIRQMADGSRQLFVDFYEMLTYSTIISEHGLSDAEKEQYLTDGNMDLKFTVTTSSGRVLTYEYYNFSDVRSLLLMGVKNYVGADGYIEKKYVESSDFFTYAQRTEKIWRDAENLFRAAELFAQGNYREYADITITPN